tara:strand:- start:114 stop:482 length:369 start_codon:yes stop_codon:yes gene_type:complete
MTTCNVNTVFTKDQEEMLDYIADYTANAFAEYFDEPEDEQRLLDELSDIGIESKEDFEDRYEGHFDGWHPAADFAEQLMVDCCCYISEDHPLYNFIDWQDVWDRLVQYDYNTINDNFFFRNA